jgi:hypothetical protein
VADELSAPLASSSLATLRGTAPSQPRRWGMAWVARTSAARSADTWCGQTPGSIRGIGTRILMCVGVRIRARAASPARASGPPGLIRGIGARSLTCGWGKDRAEALHLQRLPRRQLPATGIRAPCWRLTIAAVDIQRPCFLARCGLVRRSVRRTCSGATLNAPELSALGVPSHTWSLNYCVHHASTLD